MFFFIFRASERGDKDLVRLVLAHNHDDTGVHEVTGVSPLHAACRHGHADVVELLLLVSTHKNCLAVSNQSCKKKRFLPFERISSHKMHSALA